MTFFFSLLNGKLLARNDAPALFCDRCLGVSATRFAILPSVKLRIVIADDNPAVLRQYVFLLGNEFDIVATAPDGALALEAIRCFQPDVAVLDIAMPVLCGIELTKILQREPYRPAVVICSVENDQEFIEAAQHAGALGYVFKTHVARDLIAAVELAAKGQSFVSDL